MDSRRVSTGSGRDTTCCAAADEGQRVAANPASVTRSRPVERLTPTAY
jgi:hypothetical protein